MGISFLVDISFLVWAPDHLIEIINFHFLIPSIKLPIPRSALKVHEHLSTIIKLSIPRFSNKIVNSSRGPESAPAVHKSRNWCYAFSQSLSHKSSEGSGNTRMPLQTFLVTLGWLGGFLKMMPLCGSILQAGTCQILSLAENPRWSWVWQ